MKPYYNNNNDNSNNNNNDNSNDNSNDNVNVNVNNGSQPEGMSNNRIDDSDDNPYQLLNTFQLLGQPQEEEHVDPLGQSQSHASTPPLGLPNHLPIRISPEKARKRKASETLDRPAVKSSSGNRNANLQARSEERSNHAPNPKFTLNRKANFVSALPHTYAKVPKEITHLDFANLKESCVDLNAEFFASQDTGRIQRPPRRLRPKPSREKFTAYLLPPPAYVYVRTNDPDFNIFSNGILRFSDLSFHLADALPLRDLLNLYCVSKQYHQTLNQRFTAMIFSQARAVCYDAAIAFPWRCYAQFTRPDPANRIPNPDKAKAEQGIPRSVPSFKWVFFCLFREKAVQEIMAIMAEDGVPLHPGCKMAIMRIWFLMDLTDNSRRIAIVHNRYWFPNDIIYYALIFFIKMDMRFNDPLSRKCVQGTKNMLLSQPTLVTFLKVLKGEALKTEFEALKMWIAYKYVPRNRGEARMDLFGIPAVDVGKIQYEHWGQKLGRDPKTGEYLRPIRMLRPDELIMRELLRRGLAMGPHQFIRLFLWGYVDAETMEDYLPERRERRLDLPDEYVDDDKLGGAAVGDDPLLDLGNKGKVISSSVLPHEETVEDFRKDQADKTFLEAMTLIQHEEKLIEAEKTWAKTGKLPNVPPLKSTAAIDGTSSDTNHDTNVDTNGDTDDGNTSEDANEDSNGNTDEDNDKDSWRSESDFAIEG